MKFPNFKDKHLEDSIISPSEFMEYQKEQGKYPTFKKPEGLIFCYQKSLIQYVLENHKTTKVEGFYGEMYLLDETEGKLAIIGKFGIGAPVVVTLFEELIAFGIKKFISIGTAGTLQKHIKIGSLMLCDRAIRDEGTSHHYVESSKYAYASKVMIENIKESLNKFNQEYFVGTSWTIDAPYRETVAEARQYQSEGVATVEMEASALFVVAEYRKVDLGAIFTISDSLAELEWNPKFHSKKTKQGLEILYKVSVDALLK